MSDRETGEVYDSDTGVAQGPGAILREARVARGVSVEEIATDLRIELHLLHALENEDYPSLGAPVFAKGYIRQYASRLGIDAGPLIDHYTALVGSTDVTIQPSRAIKLHDTQQITVWIIALLALALIAVFLAVWWFDLPAGFGRQVIVSREAPAAMPFPEADATRATDPPANPPRTTGSNAPPAGPAPAAADVSPSQAGQRVSSAGATAVPTDGPETAVATGQNASAQTGSSEDLSAAGSADAGAATRPDTAAPAVVAVTDGPVVELVFTADCWVEIEDASGVRLLYGLIEAGTRHSLVGTLPFDVFLGNADAVAITVDGREFTVPGRARRGNLARFAIDSPTN